jgi:hypothetical protein
MCNYAEKVLLLPFQLDGGTLQKPSIAHKYIYCGRNIDDLLTPSLDVLEKLPSQIGR